MLNRHALVVILLLSSLHAQSGSTRFQNSKRLEQRTTLPISGDFIGIQHDESQSPDEPGVKWFHENTLVVRGNEAVLDEVPFTVSKGRKTYSASDGGFATCRGRFFEKDGKTFISLRLFQSDYIIFPVPVNGPRPDPYRAIRTYSVEVVSGELVIEGVRYKRKVLKKNITLQMLRYLKEQPLEKVAAP